MSEIIILFVFLFFAALGVSTLTAKLWLMLIRPKGKIKSFSVVKLNKNNTKEILTYCIEKYRWYGNEYADYIAFLYDEEPDEAVFECLKPYGNMTVCTEKELNEYINNI